MHFGGPTAAIICRRFKSSPPSAPSFAIRAAGAGKADWAGDTGDEGPEDDASSGANVGGGVFGDEIPGGEILGMTSEATSEVTFEGTA